MSPSENISKIIKEYSQILVRDLGFSDWKLWEPMITKIREVLGVDSLGDLMLTKASKNPGKEIVILLINRWLDGKGKYWKTLISLEESTEVTPYDDYQVYSLYVKTRRELVSGLSGEEVYLDYDIIQKIFESQDYKTLRELHGLKVTTKW